MDFKIDLHFTSKMGIVAALETQNEPQLVVALDPIRIQYVQNALVAVVPV